MAQGAGKRNSNNDQPVQQQVVDFKEIREKKLAEKRKNTERIFFKNLLSVYTVEDSGQLVPLELIEVSEAGLSFQAQFDPEHPWPNRSEQVPVRFYFSKNTYLEILVQIQNSSPCIEDGVRRNRYGCSVDRGIKSYPAYQQFVKFLKLYAEHAHKDMGNGTVFYL